MSLISASRRRPLRWMLRRNAVRRAGSVTSESSRSSEKPRIELSGVRTSWLTLARKSLLWRLATVSSSFVRSRCAPTSSAYSRAASMAGAAWLASSARSRRSRTPRRRSRAEHATSTPAGGASEPSGTLATLLEPIAIRTGRPAWSVWPTGPPSASARPQGGLPWWATTVRPPSAGRRLTSSVSTPPSSSLARRHRTRSSVSGSRTPLIALTASLSSSRVRVCCSASAATALASSRRWALSCREAASAWRSGARSSRRSSPLVPGDASPAPIHHLRSTSRLSISAPAAATAAATRIVGRSGWSMTSSADRPAITATSASTSSAASAERRRAGCRGPWSLPMAADLRSAAAHSLWDPLPLCMTYRNIESNRSHLTVPTRGPKTQAEKLERAQFCWRDT